MGRRWSERFRRSNNRTQSHLAKDCSQSGEHRRCKATPEKEIVAKAFRGVAPSTGAYQSKETGGCREVELATPLRTRSNAGNEAKKTRLRGGLSEIRSGLPIRR